MFRFIGFIFSGIFRVFVLLGAAFVLLVSGDALNSNLHDRYPELANSAQVAFKTFESFKNYLRTGLPANAAPEIVAAVVSQFEKNLVDPKTKP